MDSTSTEAFVAFPRNQSISANQHSQRVRVLPYLEEGRHLNFISVFGELKLLVNAWSPSEKKASGAVSLIYRTDNQG